MGYRLLPRAMADVEEITAYIATENPAAARRWFDRIEQRFIALGAMPAMGPMRSDIGPGVRLFPFERYVVLYHAVEDGAHIVRVVHGSRDQDTWL